jgi:replication factor C small subunit
MSEADDTGAGREEIWLEKYRPEHFEDVVGQDTIVERLVSYVSQKDLPHMLFAGPAGTGKCVTGDTPVLTSDGLTRMADAVGEVDGFAPNEDGTEVLTFADDSFEYTEPSHVFSQKTESVVGVTTRDGSEMEVTPEHKLPVLTHEGLQWREAASLTPGDRVVRPLDVPVQDTDPDLRWIDAMDGDRTFVHVTEEFAERYEIPFEENLVGTKKAAVRGLRQGKTVGDISAETGAPRKTVQAAAREFQDEPLDRPSTVCSLSYLRELDASDAQLRRHIEQIQYVTRYNKRSEPITPPWELSPELATLVGLAVSEARIENGRIKFYNTDEALIGRFEQLLRDQFGVDPRTGEQRGVPYVQIDSRTLTHYLESCFDVFEGPVADDGIGSTVLQADADSRRAFLRAVFDAEAHLAENGILELTQKDGDLITLLSYLLSTFGIPSRRTQKRKRATNGTGTMRTYHVLYVSSAPHLSRFEREIGFSIPHKEQRLAEVTDRPANPNVDTIPTQEAVTTLSQRLNLDKTDYIPESLNSETPGRKRYLDGVSDLVDAATDQLETIQEMRARLTQLEPAIDEIAATPAQRIGARGAFEPVSTRKELEGDTGVRTDRLLEYARGDRTPYTDRAQTLLAAVDTGTDTVSIQTVQSELTRIIEELDLSYNEIAGPTDLRGVDVSNLLSGDDHEIGSLPRFVTVAERLDSILSEMASLSTLDHLRTLHGIAEAGIYLDEVESVQTLDESRRVYDLTVPDTRNYVAGTVPTVMHNTTSAIAIARELYGDDWEEHFLELNASDERGIDVVRDRIKSFARTSFGGADYRIIFLDEADALTSDAQSALRRTMEQFSNNVRFILSCNYSSQIIDPIQSRTAVFRFSPLPDAAVEEQIRIIAAEEDIEVTDDGVDALVYAADGDMRKAINGLQAAAVTGGVVDEEAVFEITSTARPEDIREMVTRALDGDFTAARSRLDELITEEGIAGGDIIDQLHRSVWEFDIDDEAAVRLLDRIGEADYRITEGANERIQLEALLASLALEK